MHRLCGDVGSAVGEDRGENIDGDSDDSGNSGDSSGDNKLAPSVGDAWHCMKLAPCPDTVELLLANRPSEADAALGNATVDSRGGGRSAVRDGEAGNQQCGGARMAQSLESIAHCREIWAVDAIMRCAHERGRSWSNKIRDRVSANSDTFCACSCGSQMRSSASLDSSAATLTAGIGDCAIGEEVDAFIAEFAIDEFINGRAATATNTADGSIDGSVNGAIGGAIDGSVNRYIDGAIDGSANGYVNGSTNGYVDEPIDESTNETTDETVDGFVDGDPPGASRSLAGSKSSQNTAPTPSYARDRGALSSIAGRPVDAAAKLLFTRTNLGDRRSLRPVFLTTRGRAPPRWTVGSCNLAVAPTVQRRRFVAGSSLTATDLAGPGWPALRSTSQFFLRNRAVMA